MDGIVVITLLKERARDLRVRCLKMVKETGKGHLGGTFSVIDILVALYFRHYLNPNRKDRVIIGKGHANLAFLNIWADLGLISPEVLKTYGKDGGIGGQLDTVNTIADNITGSLGHAIGIASGIAIANKLNRCNMDKTIAIVGDGEMEEGSIWEALEFAGKQKLSNLICIVDRNRLSVTDFIEDDNLEKKAEAFGWYVKVADGHSFEELLYNFNICFSYVVDKPFMIIADTVKGKGVSFMENNPNWHHGCPTDEEYEIALRELGAKS